MPETAVQISTVPGRAVVRLKSWGPRASAMSLVPPGLGGSVRILALGPREWWVASEALAGSDLRERVIRHVVDEPMVAVDLSCAVIALTVAGRAARDLLSKSCGLDLHPQGFPPGLATRTRLANIVAVVDCLDPTPRFDLYIGRSYCHYAKAWLADAALEFDVAG
jgi:sarcosine oxidase subunit gamma